MPNAAAASPLPNLHPLRLLFASRLPDNRALRGVCAWCTHSATYWGTYQVLGKVGLSGFHQAPRAMPKFVFIGSPKLLLQREGSAIYPLHCILNYSSTFDNFVLIFLQFLMKQCQLLLQKRIDSTLISYIFQSSPYNSTYIEQEI